MKLLIVDSFHHKNMKGLEMICTHLNWKYTYKHGNISEIENEIPNYDVIYFPVRPYDPSRFPNKRFIFGPHFSVFPDNRLLNINNIHKKILGNLKPNLVFVLKVSKTSSRTRLRKRKTKNRVFWRWRFRGK